MNVYGQWLAMSALTALVGACFQTDPIELGADADGSADSPQTEVAIEVEPDVPTAEVLIEPVYCVSVTPESRHFGAVVVGLSMSSQVVVSNCGALPVRLFGSEFEAGSSPAFSFAPGQRATLDPGASHTLTIDYAPKTYGVHEGVLAVSSASGVLRVPLTGSAVGSVAEDVCPPATIVVAEGTTVIPQTVLHLSAVRTEHARGELAYTWEVSQPSGSTAVPLPSSTASDVTLETNVAGPYVVRLITHDSLAEVSCAPVEVEVDVRPTAALHVELLWHPEPVPPPELEASGAWFIVTTDVNMPVAIDPTQNDGLFAGEPGAAIAIESPPRAGSVTITEGGFVYTPIEDFVGYDIFSFHVADSPHLARVRIYVLAAGNTPPEARNDRVTTPVDVPFDTVVLLANDLNVDGDRLWIDTIDAAEHGEVVITNNGPNSQAHYVPHAGYAGPDRFRYGVHDFRGGFDWATVDIMVGDPRPGADLDLHLLDVTQDATYFDPLYDTYWRSPEPQWSTPDAGSTPRLDRDDTDGDGPENINVDAPAAGTRYCIGVHAWDAIGRDASRATVRVYIDGDLAFEADERLEHHDLWEVACIDWQTRLIEPQVDDSGAPVIRDYPRPD